MLDLLFPPKIESGERAYLRKTSTVRIYFSMINLDKQDITCLKFLTQYGQKLPETRQFKRNQITIMGGSNPFVELPIKASDDDNTLTVQMALSTLSKTTFDDADFSEWSNKVVINLVSEPTIKIHFSGFGCSLPSIIFYHEDKEVDSIVKCRYLYTLEASDPRVDVRGYQVGRTTEFIEDPYDKVDESIIKFKIPYLYYTTASNIVSVRMEYLTQKGYWGTTTLSNLKTVFGFTKEALNNLYTIEEDLNVSTPEVKAFNLYLKGTNNPSEVEDDGGFSDDGIYINIVKAKINTPLKSSINDLYATMASSLSLTDEQKTKYGDLLLAKWETVATVNTTTTSIATILETTYKDIKFEDNDIYYYGVYINHDNAGAFPLNILTDNNGVPIPFSVDGEFSYLADKERILTLAFNNNISAYTYNVSDSKIDTIGGQFPVITRNGKMKYRTFSISGTIASQMDENGVFMSSNISEHDLYDYRYELKFREDALNFLNNGKPKIYRSPTEGLMIVRLMNVNFNHNSPTNRLIGDFSATVCEVAEYTEANLLKYNLL